MNRDELLNLPTSELLTMTQTNITPDAGLGFYIARVTYAVAKTPIEKGTAARQAGFRAEQAGEDPQVVQYWFKKSRNILSSDEPQIRRELIATELLAGRALALRIERMGTGVVELVSAADEAFQYGEAMLQEQHSKTQPWDRFGTMLARHRATFEAMNGKASLGASNVIRGLWRAIRAEREDAPEKHRAFVVKQLGMNAAAGVLVVSRPIAQIPKVASARHKLALKLLG